MSDIALEVRGLRKSFGRAVVVNGLDLTVPTGQLFAFLGPSGVGKSTTLRMIAGLLRPDAGEPCPLLAIFGLGLASVAAPATDLEHWFVNGGATQADHSSVHQSRRGPISFQPGRRAILRKELRLLTRTPSAFGQIGWQALYYMPAVGFLWQPVEVGAAEQAILAAIADGRCPVGARCRGCIGWP